MRFVVSSPRHTSAVLAAAVLGLAFAPVASADLAVPALNSRTGAAYTIYLNFAGFSFTGGWAGIGNPGITPAYSVDGDTANFSATELDNIRKVWANVSGKYAGFNINVTTVDPAVGLTDPQRQTFYDNNAQMLHTVIGGDGAWTGTTGLAGLSQLDTARNAYPSPVSNNGAHTNFIYAGADPTDLGFVAGGTSHENGHALGLDHQSDVTTSPVTAYSPGEGTIGSPTSYSPIMGGQDGQARNLWRTGTMTDGSTQNDVATLLSNPSMLLTDDGISHSPLAPTVLALNGSVVDPTQAKGFINSLGSVALGVNSYTKDYFKFATNGSAINLVLNAGGQRYADGVADAGATFDGLFNIYTLAGSLVGTSTRDPSEFTYSYNGSLLGAGSYYAEVLNIGGYTSNRELTANYFTSGDYFFTGSGGFVTIPEPTTLALLGLGGMAMMARRRRNTAA